MVKKKILVSLLTAAVTLTMLAGCGSGQDNAASNADNAGNTSAATEGNAADEGTEQAASTEEEVELTFGFFGDDPEAEMKMGLANAYMEEHPNVKIEFEYCSGADYLTKGAATILPSSVFQFASTESISQYSLQPSFSI